MRAIRTVLVGLIVLVRFGPDIDYAASLSMTPEPANSRATGPEWLISPPAAVLVRPAG
jgi:hypothetical protein